MTDSEVASIKSSKPRPSRPEVRATLLAALPELQAICMEAFGSDRAADVLRQTLTEIACYMIDHAGSAITKPVRQRVEKALKASQTVLDFLDGLPEQHLAAMLSEATGAEDSTTQRAPVLLPGYQRAQELRAALAGFKTGAQAFQRQLPAGQKGRPNRSDPFEFLVEACLALWEEHAIAAPTNRLKLGGFGTFVQQCVDLSLAAAGGSIPGYFADTMRNAVQLQLKNMTRRRRLLQTDKSLATES